MIAIIDYGMGNLRSVQKALERSGAEALITQRVEDIQNADKIVLPGVGAMQSAMEKLRQLGLVSAIQSTIEKGKPFLGICLGFQLLFERSGEGGDVRGLGILKGNVEKFLSNGQAALKVPQIGWNQLNIKNTACPLFKEITNLSYVYFCHSYFVNPAEVDIIAATTDYGKDFTSSVQKNNIYGVQFHPEKSQKVGLKILKNFNEVNI
jgi:imidazole glycerol-phosphate synthase subunit HisH